MPILFTRDEIKDFLEEQGFDITDSGTLNKFIKDLKKVVKYETYRRRRKRLGHDADDTVLDSPDGRHHQRSDGTETTPTTTTTASAYTDSSSWDSTKHDDVIKIPEAALATYLKQGIAVQTESGSGESPESATGQSLLSRQAELPKSGPGKKLGSVHFSGDEERGKDETSTASAGDSPYYYDESGSSAETAPPLTVPLQPKGILINSGTQKKPEIIKKPDERKKPPPTSKRLIMKRVTATTTGTGDSVIEESDIDLGPAKRQPKSKSHFTARPHTAPTKFKVHPSGTIPTSTRYVLSGKTGKPLRPATARDEPRTLSRLNESGDSGSTSSSKKHHRSADELVYILRNVAGLDSEEDSEEETEDSDDGGFKRKKIPLPPPHIARDPVLLYHWYKTKHWDVYSIPGEDRHMQLRWNVRAKTIGTHIR